MSLIDYGNVLFMCALSDSLSALDTVDHIALRFITGRGHLTHGYRLHVESGWPSLSTQRESHWMLVIYEALLS